VDAEGGASAEAAGGSANDGKTSGSIDSCACAATTAAKKIPATNARIGRRTSGLEILPTVFVVVRSGNGAKRGFIERKPVLMAARLVSRFDLVNTKNPKIFT
jgi:hypothetical protein